MAEVKPLCLDCGTPLPSQWRRICHKCTREFEEEQERLDDEELDRHAPAENMNEVPDGMVRDQYHGWIWE